jgi:hypothetical protein
MASTSETGHGKNIGNFESLITYCKGYGADYNPSEKSQTLTELQKKYTTCQASQTMVNSLIIPYSKAVDERSLVFKPLKPLTTRLINAFAACKVSPNTLDNAKTYAAKIKGSRINPNQKPPIDPENPNPESKNDGKSVSQVSFDNQINNFELLIETLKGEPKYKPNETDLQVTTLEAHLANMRLKNSAAISATEPLSTARINRNNDLYNETTGLVTLAQEVKSYVKSVYGATHPKYKQISGIKFTKYKK